MPKELTNISNKLGEMIESLCDLFGFEEMIESLCDLFGFEEFEERDISSILW